MSRTPGRALLTVSQYAAAVGIHRVSAYERIRAGKVRYRKAYGRIRIFPDQVQAASATAPATAPVASSPAAEEAESVSQFTERLMREAGLV